MDALDIVKAIKFLKPNAEFSFEGTDYDSINWTVLEGKAPSWQELEVAHQAVQQAEKQAEAEAAAKRQAALGKLEALGLDEDDLRALGL